MPDRRSLSPRMATASRRAAALYAHWSRSEPGVDGELAVLRELEPVPEEWTALVCALLNLTCGLVKAARDGREDEYLAHVLREAMLDEVADA